MNLKNRKNTKKYYIKTFGCQMNYSDSERFASICEYMGYKPTKDFEEADLLAINTCSVRQKAEDRVIGMGKRIKELKRKNPDMIVILTGCMAKRSWDHKTDREYKIKIENKLKKKMPWLDMVLEINDISMLPNRLGIMNAQLEEEYLSIEPKYSSNYQANVPISTGCDMHCTFCIVPFARGKERDRKASIIYKEVKNLIDKGYKDITLLGQTVNSWSAGVKKFQQVRHSLYGIKQTDLAKGRKEYNDNEELNDIKDFADLLLLLDTIDGDWWFSFISSHPNFFSDKLIDTIGKLKHIKPYIHFAVQSGSNKILQKMNRKYKIEDYKEIVRKIREVKEGVAITTDIIVGFPSETEEDFQKTLELMEEVKYDMAYLNEYSPRSGTPSAKYLKDDIPVQEKAKRKDRLNDVLRMTALEQNKKLLRKIIRAIVYDHKKDLLIAKTGQMKDIRILNTEDLKEPFNFIGELVNIKVINVSPWGLEGDIIID